MSRHHQPVPGLPSRAGLYVRVSAVNGRAGDRFHSPDLQLDAMRRHIAQRNLTEVAAWTDLDRTGRSFQREGITAAFEAAKAGAIDVLVVLDLSRFGRNTGESLRNIAELRDLGVSVMSTTEQIDDSPEGQFMLGQFLGMAQLYSDQIGRRWGQIHQRRFEAGQFHGKIPLGYLNVNGQAEVDPVLGPLIMWAFGAYLDGTTTQKAIAARLSEAKGSRVRQGVVSNLLRNPFHTGLVMYRRERRPGRHTPLVTPEVFAAVQRKLARDIGTSPRTRGPVSFLAGLVVCAACEQPVHRRGRGVAGEDGHLRPRLRCSTPDCVGVGAPFVADVEAAVLARTLEIAAGYADGAAVLIARSEAVTESHDRQRQLTGEQRRLVKSIDRAGEKLLAGVLADDEYTRLVGPMRERLAMVVGLIGDLEDAPVRRPVEELRNAAERLEAACERGMTALETRAAVGCFLERVWLARAAYRGQPVAERLRYPEGS